MPCVRRDENYVARSQTCPFVETCAASACSLPGRRRSGMNSIIYIVGLVVVVVAVLSFFGLR